MPELPDVEVYREALERRVVGAVIERVEVRSPFLVRTWDPPIDAVVGLECAAVARMGKRLVFELGPGSGVGATTHWLVVHLMIAGRFRWIERDTPAPKQKIVLAVVTCSTGQLVLTEAGSKKRAALHLFSDESALRVLDRGGIEIASATRAAFRERLLSENRTLKRALTDPGKFSGIGNAYSDEILHRARLSPITWTTRLEEPEIDRLFDATVAVLEEWTERLREQYGDAFPTKVTAFRPEMAVHGKFREPCPVCGTAVQRIVHASNETNYCPRCQTGGKLLRDRALSRVLREDWPRTIDEWEEGR